MPLEKLTSMAVEIDRRDLPNRVTTPCMLVKNSADWRGFAQCRDTLYGTPTTAPGSCLGS